MKFQVPQFVEIEDKIFWALTLKQFIYLAGGSGLSVLFYIWIQPFWIAIFFIVPVAGLSLALAFYRYNDRPFIFFLESMVKFLFNSRLYIWKKEEGAKLPSAKNEAGDNSLLGFAPKFSQSKLKDLTWLLDAKEGLNPGTEETGQK